MVCCWRARLLLLHFCFILHFLWDIICQWQESRKNSHELLLNWLESELGSLALCVSNDTIDSQLALDRLISTISLFSSIYCKLRSPWNEPHFLSNLIISIKFYDSNSLKEDSKVDLFYHQTVDSYRLRWQLFELHIFIYSS